jgi:hypothetical protein
MKSLALFGLLVAAGCQAGTPTFDGDTFLPPGGADVLRSALATTGDGPNGAHIIFLNYNGQHIQPPTQGYDNPNTGESWITQYSTNYAAFDASPYAAQFSADQARNAITNYFQQFYAPFNVQVVTTRPSGLRYTMCLIGDDASTVLGSGSGGAAGIAPLDCQNRNEEEITYAFAAGLSPRQTGLSLAESLKSIAVTAAQETAHSYGLSHTNNTQDIMYPQLDLAQSAFVDASMGLINNPNGACGGATTQNSKQLLGANIGFGNGGPVGPSPTVKFVAPQANDTVPLKFTIIVDASETGGTIDRVEIGSGGMTLFTWKTLPYRDDVMAPSAGSFQLTATAFDTNGNFQSSAVTFTASSNAPAQQLPPCQSNSQCPSTQTCSNGACVASGGTTTGSGGTTTGSGGTTTGSGGTTTGSGGTTNGGGSTNGGGNTNGGSILTGIPTGGDCSNPDGTECQSSTCYQGDGDHHYCTTVCDPAVVASCPMGMSCTADSGTHLCTYPKSRGCSAAPGAPGNLGFGFLLMLALVALRLGRTRG